MQLGTFTRNWRWQPAPPPPPAPEPLRLRPPTEPQHGNFQRGCFSVWSIYCHVTGKSSDDDRMRRVLAKLLGRPVATRKSLSNEEWRRAAREFEFWTQCRDGGLHTQLFGHCPTLSANRKALLPAVYAALLGFQEPTPLFGAERETWLRLLGPLEAHTHGGCPGGDDCSLLREAKLLAETARRAA